MHLMYFTEQPMSAYSPKAGLDFGAIALMFSRSMNGILINQINAARYNWTPLADDPKAEKPRLNP